MKRRRLCISLTIFSTLFSVAPLHAAAHPRTVDSQQVLNKTYFIGHLNPDADAIVGALAAAQLFKGIAARSGELNAETHFILEKFKLPTPELLVNSPDKKYYLVDFNQHTQLLGGVSKEQIVGIIDHHAIQSAYAGPNTPIDLQIRAWGSSCTLITDMFLQRRVPIPRDLAGGMLGAIISDTLNLTSPTTTDPDRRAVSLLAKIAGVQDITALAKEQFRAKSKTSHLSAQQLLQQDFKSFELNGKKVGFGEVETLFPEEVIARQQELRKEMTTLKIKEQFAYMLFAVVQPESKESVIIVEGAEEASLVTSAFGGEVRDFRLNTSPRVSRKLEFVPALQKCLH
jgi:manganese-dependent inorganic pyrophosphatase